MHQIVEEISRAMVASANLVEFLQTTVELITEELYAAQTTLITFDTIQRTITHFISSDVNLQQASSASIDEIMENLSNWALVEYKSENKSSSKPVNPGEHEVSQSGSNPSISAPLIYGERILGVLTVERLRGGSPFTGQDMRFMSVIANLVAMAVENARLYSAERRRVGQLDALRATVADISAELELSKLLKAIVKRAAVLLNTTGGDLGLYDDNRHDLLIVVSHNMGRDYAGTRMAVGEGAMGLSIKRREAVIIENYSEWENASFQYNTGPWSAVLAVPIMIGKRVMGSIGMVDSDPQRRFTASDQHLLSLFAQHAAIAVENANLYKAAREAAERRAILHQVSQAIVAASLEPEGIYTAIHQAAAQLMPAEAFAITRYNEAKQIIDAVYLVDRGERYPIMQIPTNRGVSNRVINSGESVYIPDTLAARDLGDAIHFGDQEQVRSVLAVPMYLRGKVVGMLSTQSYRPWGYTPEDQYLLEMLAAYAAIALDNASLFAHIQQLAITDAVTQIFNRRHLFDLGQREFLRARRFNRLLSVIMLDIDYFKQVNDSYGHAAGDKTLYKLAQLLKSTIREIDIVGRYG